MVVGAPEQTSSGKVSIRKAVSKDDQFVGIADCFIRLRPDVSDDAAIS